MAHKMTEIIPCTVCGKPSWSRKLCNNHYKQAHKKKLLTEHPRITADDVLLGRIEKTDTCWLWAAKKNVHGYGVISVNGSYRMAHRLVYEKLVGPIPKGLNILHSCDNPACVNPAHLRSGSQKENLQDAVERRRMPYGEQKSQHKLKTEQVLKIRVDPRPNVQIAKEYGVSATLIGNIKKGTRRKRE